MKMIRLILALLFLTVFFAKKLTAQDLEEIRKEQIPNMNIAPNFMGPNALPIPGITKGMVRNKRQLDILWMGSFSAGDNTQTINLELDYTVVKDLISVFVHFTAFEYFEMSEDERIRRGINPLLFESSGTEVGDIYYGFELQLLKNRPKGPDLLVRGAVKTAPGENVENGRFTDTPGYFFDVSAGREFELRNGTALRPYLMLGFYSWQTYDIVNPQNDAPVYGIGIDWQKNNLTVSTDFTGYTGWKQNGDNAQIVRLEVNRQLKRVGFTAGFQQGINDFPFSTAVVGISYQLDQKINVD